MTLDFSTREATVADLFSILHHRREMFREMGFTDSAALDAMIASSGPFIRQALTDGSYRGWLAETKRTIAAGAGVLVTPWVSNPRDIQARRAYVLNVYTEPEYRRLGLSRRLMEVIIDWCRRQGFGTIHLHASEMGRSLYESLGFKLSNEMRLTLK